MVAIELREPYHCRAFDETQSNALIAQRHYPESRVWSNSYKIARINLKLESPAIARGERVAFDEREVQLCSFPIGVAVAF
jgi:hypothetical protein